MLDIKNKVYLSKCENYDYENVKNAVATTWEQMGYSSLIKKGDTVVIKPNLLMKRKPEEVTTTHPMVVKCIIEQVKKCSPKEIIIAESSGGTYSLAAIKPIYQTTGFLDLANETNVTLNMDFGFDTMKSKGEYKKTADFSIINPVFKADVIINVAKLKSHSMTGISGATKNLFGFIPGLLKPEMHFRFPEKDDFANMLVDLAQTINPTINFVDSVFCMEGDGPSGGKGRFGGFIASSQNSFNVDILCATLIEMKPTDIFMLKFGNERGYCPKTVDELTILGEDYKGLIIKNFVQPKVGSTDFYKKVPKFIRPLAKKLTEPKPIIKTKNCIGCGKCAQSCPQHTIKIENKKAKIDYSKCIKCFCCHEMCPVKTIDIKRNSLLKL